MGHRQKQMANRRWHIGDGKADVLHGPIIPVFPYSIIPALPYSTVPSFPGPFVAAGGRIVQNKANLARQGRWIDEGLLMIDYWERRAMEDGKAGATTRNKADLGKDRPSGPIELRGEYGRLAGRNRAKQSQFAEPAGREPTSRRAEQGQFAGRPAGAAPSRAKQSQFVGPGLPAPPSRGQACLASRDDRLGRRRAVQNKANSPAGPARNPGSCAKQSQFQACPQGGPMIGLCKTKPVPGGRNERQLLCRKRFM